MPEETPTEGTKAANEAPATTTSTTGKPCPEEQAGFLSRWLYHWMNDFVWIGYRKPLEQQDLYDLTPNSQASVLADKFEAIWQRKAAEVGADTVQVTPILYEMFGRRYSLACLLHILQALTNNATPILINFLILFVGSYATNKPQPLWLGFVWAVVFLVLQLVSSLALNKYFYFSTRTGMRVRACLTAVCYRKMMKLDQLALQKFSSGQIINMIQSDVTRLEMFLMQGAYVISGPLQICVILALLIYFIGPSALVGVGILIFMIPIQAVIFMRLGTLRRRTASTTDSRIRSTQEFLQGIRIIKFFAWEEKFVERLLGIRNDELSKIQYANMWTAILMGVSTSVPVLAAVVSIIVWQSQEGLNPAKAFTAISYFNMLRFPLILLPSIIRALVESKVSVERLTALLNASEIHTIKESGDRPDDTGYSVIIENGNFQWEVLPESEKFKDDGKKKTDKKNKKAPPPAVQPAPADTPTAAPDNADDQPIEMKQQPRVQLRNVNLKIKKGATVAVVGAVGSGKSTLLKSLLGEVRKVSGEVRLHGSVGYCLQQPWIKNGTLRDNITFGNPYDEQKYKEAVKVSALQKDLEWLPGGSDALLGEKGIQASGGQRARVSLARVVYCGPDIVLLDDPLSAVDVHVGKHIFKYCIKRALKDKTVILVTHHLNYLNEVDYIVYIKDGEIVEQGTYDELMANDKELAQMVRTYAGGDEGDLLASPTDAAQTGDEKMAAESAKKANVMLEEERQTGSVDPVVYREYVTSAGGPFVIAVVLGLVIFTQLANVGTNIWLTYWTAGQLNSILSDTASSLIYLSWGISQGLFTAALGFLLSYAFAAAGRKFHFNAIQSVFRAPISFFDSTPLGRIVTRFSRDTDILDNQLPMAMQMFLSIFSGLVATLVLMCTYAYYLIGALVPILVIFFFMQRLYMRNSRELKRLDGLTKSPVVSHFGESITGLSTIRAYQKQSQFMQDCFRLIDRNNQAIYLQLMLQRWLGLRLETLGSLFSFCTAVVVSIAGLILSYSLNVTGSLNFAVRQAVEVETQANGIERLYYYAKKLDQEAPLIIEDHRPPEKWPDEGKIDVHDLVLKYTPTGDPVLKQISLGIRAREKIGVVGRTGAGKSTVTLGLFRMLEAAGGSITIDGINISSVGLHDLRSRLAIIPQDPILFSGTVRTNLDPFNQRLDKDIWEVLASVNMKDAISKLNEGLEAKVEPNGENFSTGQRQLLCLARAMLRHPRVLIMDEATANVDMASDAFIQTSLRKDFKESTIITIAHRLNTVIDYDRILVLELGEIAEFDSPARLLERGGLFAKLVDNTGPVNSAMLRKLAQEKEKGTVDVAKLLEMENATTS